MAVVRVHGVRRSRHSRTLLAVALVALVGVAVAALVPWRCNSEPGPRDVLNRGSPSPAADAATLRRGQHAFYADDLGSVALLSDDAGLLDGPLRLRSLTWSLVALRGRGTTNLRVTLPHDTTIGGRTFARGEPIDTGLDVAEGSLLPLGVVVHVDYLRVRVGFTCALCHAAVDPETRQVIQGAANNDLQLGLLLALADNSAALAAHAGVPGGDEDDVDRVFLAWPPGSYDATTDGVANPTRIPDAFTRDEGPYGWNGSGRSGPFRGLATFIQKPDCGHPFAAPDPSKAPQISWDTALAIAGWLNTLTPPPVVVDTEAAARGRAVFARANCGRCHSGPALSNEQPTALDQVATDPSRAGDRGEYEVPGLLGLWWSAPYLHDGGVAVAHGELKVGVAETRAAGVPVDPRASLRALLDRELRHRVVAANRADRVRWDQHVRGVGHEFWVDPAAGYSPAEQDALIEHLLSLRAEPDPR
jgi:hypothetical protein